jgi:hypothetical protein
MKKRPARRIDSKRFSAGRRTKREKRVKDRRQTVQKVHSWDSLPVLAAFILVVVFSFLHPVKIIEPDAWGYYFAARAFGSGTLTADGETFQSWTDEAVRGGHRWQGDIGFAPVGPNRYGFVKAPGYALLLAAFNRLGLLRFLNPLLGFLAVLIGFRACARLLDAGTAATAAFLMIFSPGFLIMFHRPYMSDFASFALVTAGAALYLIYLRGADSPWRPGYLLLFSGLTLAAAAAVRYTNLTLAGLFACHLLYTFASKKKDERGRVPPAHLAWFFAPVVLVFALLGCYHTAVFGAPWRLGYHVIEHPRSGGIHFAHQYLWAGDVRSAVYGLIRNMAVIPRLLIPLIPATVCLLPGIYAFRVLKGHHRRLLLLWIALFWVIYAEYIILQSSVYLIIGRMYLPVLLPTAVFSGALLHRLGTRERKACLAGFLILGVIFLFSFLAAEGSGPLGPCLEDMKVIIWQGQAPPMWDPG